MTAIFICYRRGDTAGWTGRLYDRLAREWGDQHVFMDIDDIAPGEDFRHAINATLARCDVLLAVIGPDWLTAPDPAGQRRIDNEADYVHMEIRHALERNVRVIPVLVKSAAMPTSEQLPSPLRPLAFRQAFELSEDRFNRDVDLLIARLDRGQAGLAPPEAPDTIAAESASPPMFGDSRPAQPKRTASAVGMSAGAPRRGLIPLVTAIIAALAVIVLVLALNQGSETDEPPGPTAARTASPTVDRGNTLSGCVIDISNPLATIHVEPDTFSQEIVDVPPGSYAVEEERTVSFGLGEQRWFLISVSGRSGWLRDSTFNVESKSADCP